MKKGNQYINGERGYDNLEFGAKISKVWLRIV